MIGKTYSTKAAQLFYALCRQYEILQELKEERPDAKTYIGYCQRGTLRNINAVLKRYQMPA